MAATRRPRGRQLGAHDIAGVLWKTVANDGGRGPPPTLNGLTSRPSPSGMYGNNGSDDRATCTCTSTVNSRDRPPPPHAARSAVRHCAEYAHRPSLSALAEAVEPGGEGGAVVRIKEGLRAVSGRVFESRCRGGSKSQWESAAGST